MSPEVNVPGGTSAFALAAAELDTQTFVCQIVQPPASSFAAARRYPGEWSTPDIDSSFVANPK
jgi:hypothetical protein